MPRIVFIALAVLALGLVTAGGAYLVGKIDRTAAVLAATETTLEITEEWLDETQKALNQTTADLRAERIIRNGLQRDKLSLQADKAALTDDLAAAAAAQDVLQAELGGVERQVATLRGEQQDLEADHAALQASHQDWQDALGTVLELADQADTLRTDIAGLQEEREALRTDIADLQEEREPLILAAGRARETGFLCTGSMEPLLTCLDTGVLMPAVAPGEIDVGAIIVYAGSACGPDALGSTIHRVIDVQEVDGVHYYWPKGDALAAADGCWVPETAVYGYLVALRKDTVPANAELRDQVNATKAAAQEAWDAFLNLVEANCGHRDHTQCSVSPRTSLGQQYQAALERFRAAEDVSLCWYDNAAASEYPGHIPYECGDPAGSLAPAS